MHKNRVPDIYSKEGLPENWEMLTDSSTGWPYFANHHEKITTWEDPRPGMAQYSENSGNLIPDHNVEKRSPSPQPQLSPLELVQQIASEANKLQEQVSNFKDAKASKAYKFLEEMLTRLLLKLDGVESDGKEQIRDIRRGAVKTVQACIDQLELKAMSFTES